MKTKERHSPFRPALAYGALGIAALVGGNIASHHDGPGETAPAALAELGGGLLAVAGVLKAGNVLAERQVLAMRAEKAKERQKLLEGLPKLQDSFDPVHIVNRLKTLQDGGKGAVQGVDPSTVSERLWNTVYGVRRAPRFDLLLECFHDDVRKVVDELADSKIGGIGSGLHGYIFDRGDDVLVLPDQVTQFACFLDDAAPIDPGYEHPDWHRFISSQARNIQWARLIDEPSGDIV